MVGALRGESMMYSKKEVMKMGSKILGEERERTRGRYEAPKVSLGTRRMNAQAYMCSYSTNDPCCAGQARW
jgi:hypothetical protein